VQLKAGVVFINGRPLERRREPDGVTDMGEGEVPVERYEEINPEGRAYLINALEQNQSAENTGVYVVPPRCYFLLGDNRDNSIDSRFDPNMTFNDVGSENCGWDPALDTSVPDEPGVGFVPEEELEGRAQMVLFSTSRPDRLMRVLK
jgi:signal peptidase I